VLKEIQSKNLIYKNLIQNMNDNLKANTKEKRFMNKNYTFTPRFHLVYLQQDQSDA